MTALTFGVGARGYLVRILQEKLSAALGRGLPGGVDGEFGKATSEAVADFAKFGMQDPELRRRAQEEGAFYGLAGPAVFQSLGLAWPDAFARCLQLTMGFEGTGFGGAVGPAQTGDTAGVTYGIIGFTSGNGELQELVRELLARVDSAGVVTRLGLEILGSREFDALKGLVDPEVPAVDFERWALDGGGRVRSVVQRWFKALGDTEGCCRLQMEWAFMRYWKRAEKQALALYGAGMEVRSLALLFDVAVQNGGLAEREIADLVQIFKNDPALTEDERRWRVCTLLTTRLRAKKRPEFIIEDVRSRKGTICRGEGVVHGQTWTVRAFGV